MTRSRRAPLCLVALGVVVLALAALWAPRPAAAALTAGTIRIVDRPASVRVVVHFRGGRLTGLGNQVDATDPDISDGRAVVRVNAPGIRTAAPAAGRAGVVVQIARRGGHIVVLLDDRPGVRGALQVRVVPDLGAAQRPGDRPLEGHHPAGRDHPGRRLPADHPLARRERQDLGARPGAGAALRARPRPVPPAGGRRRRDGRPDARHRRAGRFRPDFSGYSVPGRWSGVVRHSVSGPTRAMLEAWSTSAKDGSLECLVQVPVILRP